MGWDDDDEDLDEEALAANLQAQLKEKERQKRRDEGLDSESEGEKAAKEAATKPKPKPKPKKEEKSKEPEKVLTDQERKLLQRKLEEEQDLRLASDLFAGVGKATAAAELEAKEKAEQEDKARRAAEKPKVIVQDAFDRLELAVLLDVETLAATCVEKLDKGSAKGLPGKFLVDLLKLIEDNLDTKELTEIEKAVAELVKAKKAVKGTVTDAKASKANTKCTKTTKFNATDAWSEVYGGGDGDEEWTPEEWADWEAKQTAAATK